MARHKYCAVDLVDITTTFSTRASASHDVAIIPIRYGAGSTYATHVTTAIVEIARRAIVFDVGGTSQMRRLSRASR